MTTNLAKTMLSAITFLLLAAAPVAADDADTQPPPQAPAQSAAEPQPADGMTEGCAAGGKCCGSSSCAEAKRKSIEEGKAAVSGCACGKNRAKPKRTLQ